MILHIVKYVIDHVTDLLHLNQMLHAFDKGLTDNGAPCSIIVPIIFSSKLLFKTPKVGLVISPATQTIIIER